MAYEVKGVVARSKGAPVTIETIIVPDPGPGEAVVDVQACGVCHTDLHYREGGINDDFPFLLGHEAAGNGEAVGDGGGNGGAGDRGGSAWGGAGVAIGALGDAVLIAWRAPCGRCRSCARGKPWYCFDSANATQRMTLDG